MNVKVAASLAGKQQRRAIAVFDPVERIEGARLQRHRSNARLRLRVLELALGEGAAHVDNAFLPIAPAIASSSAHDSNGCCSLRLRTGLSTPTFAGLMSIIPHATARWSTCRSAWVASKR